MENILLIFSDRVWLPLLEIIIAIIFIRSVISDIAVKLIKNNLEAKVKRGEKGFGILIAFWGLSIILIEIILSSDLINNFRIIVGLANVAVLFYLIICSAYFKNKIVGWYIKFTNWFQKT